MATTRFNKTKLLADLRKRFNDIQAREKFDRGNGWAQVKNSPIERVVAYGTWREVETLIRMIEGGDIGS